MNGKSRTGAVPIALVVGLLTFACLATAPAAAQGVPGGLLASDRESRSEITSSGGALRGPPPAGPDTVLSLHWAVRQALGTHPSVAAARHAVSGSAASVREARGERLPLVAAAGSLAHYKEPMLVAPIHGFDFEEPPPFDDTLIRGTLAFSQILIDGGSRRGRVRAAQATEGQAGAALRSTEMALITRAAAAFLTVRTMREVLEAQTSRTRALTAERDRVLRFLEVGRAARVELLRADAALSEAEAEGHSTVARLRVAELDLARLTGTSNETIASGTLVAAGIRVPGEAWSAAGAEAPTPPSGPEVDRARQAVLAAEASRAVARSAWFPQVEAGGAYNGFGSGGGAFSGEWQVELKVAYPIFVGGTREGSIDRAEAELWRAREELRLVELQVSQEVDEIRAAVVEATARADALTEAVSQFEEVARIEALTLEAGAGVQRDLLAAEASLFEARAALAESRHAVVAAHINLARAQGILDLAWLEENVETER